MPKVTVDLKDESLYQAVRAAATKTERSVQDIVAEALEQWLAEVDTDEQDQAEIEAARREWREKGGVEAHEFFRRLNDAEESHQ